MLLALVLFAALTSSEREQVRHYVATGKAENAAKARALVARTDNTAEENQLALRDAFVAVAFDEARVGFARELLFGGASASARPSLAAALVHALLARADAVYAKQGVEPDGVELTRIYAFIAGEIAGRRGPQSGIPDAAYAECARLLAAHVAGHPAVLGGKPSGLGPATFRARAQAALAMLDLMAEAPTRRIDLADRLGLVGARRTLLADTGVLVVDDGRAADARIAKVRGLLLRLPGARGGVDALVLGEERAQLRTRSSVIAVRSGLDARSPEAATADALAWGDEVEAAPLDAGIADLALELAAVTVRRALDRRGDLAVVAARDALLAVADPQKPGVIGRPLAATPAATLAPVVALLALDAPRVIDLVAARATASSLASAAILSDALGVLAAHAPPGDATSGLAIALGQAGDAGKDPGAETVSARFVQLAPTGAVTAFALGEARWEIARDPEGRITALRRDGAQPALAALPTARVPLVPGSMWQEGKTVFARMVGAPRAGLAPGRAKGEGPRVRVAGAGGRVEAIGTPAPAGDVAVEAELRVAFEPGGIAVRAAAARDGMRGATLVVTPGAPGGPAKASLVVGDGDKDVELVAPVELPPGDVHRVRLSVRGAVMTATVDGVKLEGPLPAALATGDVAIRTRKAGSVELGAFSVSRPR